MGGSFNLMEMLIAFIVGVLVGDLAGWARHQLRKERDEWENEAAKMECEIENQFDRIQELEGKPKT